jgi:flagellar basal body rod protein FlgF
VALEGEGWIAVQAPDGGEAYTRAGDLRVDPLGRLTNGAGHPVMGEGGPIALPPFEQIEIGGDGTVTIRPLGQPANALAVVERIRLVNPDPATLRRGEDGLIRAAAGDGAAGRCRRAAAHRRARGQQREHRGRAGGHDPAVPPVRAASEDDERRRGRRPRLGATVADELTPRPKLKETGK